MRGRVVTTIPEIFRLKHKRHRLAAAGLHLTAAQIVRWDECERLEAEAWAVATEEALARHRELRPCPEWLWREAGQFA